MNRCRLQFGGLECLRFAWPVFCWLVAALLGWSNAGQAAVSLTVTEVRARALQFNRGYLAALEDVNKAHSDIVKARSGALPNLTVSAGYQRNLEVPSFFFFTPDGVEEIRTGADNAFDASVTVSQAIWHGGKVFTAWSIAKEYKRYSESIAAHRRAEMLANAEVLFYRTILEGARLAVFEKALEATTANLEVAEQKHAQGMISEYEVLRARVERANLLPGIIQAESQVDLARKRLKSFLGIDLAEEIVIVEEPDDTSLATLPEMSVLIDEALAARPEMQEANLLVDMAQKAVKVARGGYFPNFDAFSRYAWSAQSDEFTLRENTTDSWTAGITMTFPIFRGGYTRGEVSQYKAEYNQARLRAMQVADDVRLEVEQTYDGLVQAKKALDVQSETIAQAEEGLRIANLRYDSGVGTQLEVLSAQTALTDARRSLAEATFAFRSARTMLKKATTVNIDHHSE